MLVNRDQVRPRARGQYVSGSNYTWGGAWAELEAGLGARWIARAGARVSYVSASSPGERASGTAPVDRAWAPVVGNAGLEWWPSDELGVFANIDQGVRAPNLDDLTSRQRTGPGFQIENPALEPERAVTYELGVALAHRGLELDAWAFVSTLDDAIARTTRDASACPDGALDEIPECLTTRSRLQLVNLTGTSLLWGAEASARWRSKRGLDLGATVSWAWGDAPRPNRAALTDRDRLGDRLPISRVPPLNGTAELLWRPDWARGAYAGAGLRWAARQDRLALADEVDARIPIGGTPGFAVLDLRAGWRAGGRSGVFVVVENVTDAAYRYHGSSVNGAGLGAIVTAQWGWD